MSRMRREILVALLGLLFILEGTVLPWLIPDIWQDRIGLNLVYIVILFVAIYRHRHTALILGLVFGLLHDVIYYGSMIGPYSFSMGVSAYLLGLVLQVNRAPMPIMMTVVMLGSLLNDSILFGIYKIFNLVGSAYDWALVQYMIPNLFIHFVFALIIYVPLRKQLELLGRRAPKEETV
ncbi:rod shape-determining protein MreD [Paenibacillus sp. JX-17]|uniref:Rod shape-determining protein MreD n=1 Tax=Paenibacillus lacisoli TaxID=3064525 RepID=A0ABT9CC96_9BACL|nr:rod shape-determining protein MreD [Paenibacillus sp. JX-17]MDO7906885.1 rod shape-determining protein MreD [Paenibacillus sp. JX-17]